MLMKIHMASQQLTSNAHEMFLKAEVLGVFSIRLNFIDLKNHSGRDTISSK